MKNITEKDLTDILKEKGYKCFIGMKFNNVWTVRAIYKTLSQAKRNIGYYKMKSVFNDIYYL